MDEKQRVELEALNNMPDDEIDFSDIPETLDWSKGIRGAFHHLASLEKPTKPADTTEKGLEALICNSLIGNGWLPGDPQDYERAHCVDLRHISAFLTATQPETAAALDLDTDSTTRRRFLDRLKREVGNRGIIDVLRRGIQHGPSEVTLIYGTPTPGNTQAEERYRQNRFSVTRQLRYSTSNQQLSLDIGLFVNGLPIATVELKNRFTGQTVADAVEQYKTSRSPQEDLFRMGRCAVHFAVDDEEVKFCTELKGKASDFLPFNKGKENGGAGNPVNPNGVKTAYLWEEILTPEGLTDILENYAQKANNRQIWPRYHQLGVVRKLLSDAKENGAGRRYLVPALSRQREVQLHRLGGTATDRGGTRRKPAFDSIIVITDRRVLDRQINGTIRQFTQVASTVGHADRSGDLRRFITEGKKIIITTVQKFPFILDDIGNDHRDRKFAIIIDEAHSSQGGKAAGAVAQALGEGHEDEEDDDTFEDQINRIIESRKLLSNASYLAFTATPKNKTLEIFGTPDPQPDGTVRHLPFHNYTMKQAIEEGFIMDVLTNYTPISRYFNVIKSVDDDPQFDSKRAQRKLRRYVENHEYAIAQKAAIIVDHFNDSVFVPKKMGGQARAMLVTDGVDRAVRYYNAIRDLLHQRELPFRALVAFSGSRKLDDQELSEALLNGFPESSTAERFQEDPYRILICADKFQTGYDEPLLHTMYVDKHLSGIRAVQTLSRLNRFHPKKSDTFVLDFMNTTEVIQESFGDYYRTTILSGETDPDKLHDLKGGLDQAQIYSQEEIDDLVEKYLKGEERSTFEPVLGQCTERFVELTEDEQVRFKGSAKSFVRLYGFLSQILPYTNAGWEKLSIFLNFLIPKLPAPEEQDLSLGILEAVDMETYRTEKQATVQIALEDKDAEIEPIQAERGGGVQEPLLELLSLILDEFNKTWGNSFSNPDHVSEIIKDMPDRVNEDEAYQNAKMNSDRQNARIEHDAAMKRQITAMLRDNTELYRKYTEDQAFQDDLNGMIFKLTYHPDQ